MRKTILFTSATILLGIGSQAISVSAAEAFPREYDAEDTITFETGNNEIAPSADPENPDPIDPVGPIDLPGSGTDSALSIDYGSKFKLGTRKVSTAGQTYYAAPDEMEGGSKKPIYVQVTDKRGTLVGWKLTPSRPEQFKIATGEELVGTQLAFVKVEAASVVDEKYRPTEVSSTISLAPGVNNNLAMNVKKETGVGTWVCRFGSNGTTNKETVRLFVPGKSTELAQQYSAELVWTLGDASVNN